MDPETATPATRTAVTPRLEVSLEDSGPFLRAAGLVFDDISATRVTGHLELGSEHHTPWGVVLRAKLQVAGDSGRGDVVEDEARGAQERAGILQGDLEARRNRGPGRRGGGLRVHRTLLLVGIHTVGRASRSCHARI